MAERRNSLARGPVRRTVDGLAQVLALVAVLCIVVMVFATSADVLRRWIDGRAIAGVTELAEVAMVFIVFLSLAYAESRGAHVAMTLVQRKLTPRPAAILNGVGMLVMVVIVGWMLIVTADRAIDSFAQQEFRFGLVRIPVWPARIAIAVGLAAYFCQLLLRFIDDVKVATGHRRAARLLVASDQAETPAHESSGV